MHLWRRFDQTAVNEEFYKVTLSQTWKTRGRIIKIKHTFGKYKLYNLQPDGH